jgi:hypothetical protein
MPKPAALTPEGRRHGRSDARFLWRCGSLDRLGRVLVSSGATQLSEAARSPCARETLASGMASPHCGCSRVQAPCLLGLVWLIRGEPVSAAGRCCSLHRPGGQRSIVTPRRVRVVGGVPLTRWDEYSVPSST